MKQPVAVPGFLAFLREVPDDDGRLAKKAREAEAKINVRLGEE